MHTLRISLLWHKFRADEVADKSQKYLATVTSIMFARQIFASYGFKLDFRPQYYGQPGTIVTHDGKIDFKIADKEEKYCDAISDKFPLIAERNSRLPVLFARSCFMDEVAAFEANKGSAIISGVYCWRTEKNRKPYVMVSDEGYGPDILAHEILHAGADHILENAPGWNDMQNLMNVRPNRPGYRTKMMPQQVEGLKRAYFCSVA